MIPLPISIVDAFTSAPFGGNPAAVCLLDAFLDDAQLQSIATEMNLSETAFLVHKQPRTYALRWFTPTVEVNLCGHATLAATHILLTQGHIQPHDTVTFLTQSGELTATADTGNITLDFPVLAGITSTAHPALNGLGVSWLNCEKNRDNYLVEVEDYATLLRCTPNFTQLLEMDMQGVIVTTATGIPAGYDFASRYFGPPCGVNEDPVTGSAHCFLAPYWETRLGKKTFHALQASTRRGVLHVTLASERVQIAGSAVTTLTGQFLLPSFQRKEQAA